MVGLISLTLMIGLIWLEIVVFGLVGHKIGVVLTIIGVFVTAAIGLRLFRISGRSTLARLSGALAQGRAPLLEVADGAAIMLAAVLLLIPGYATDALGFVLFIPGIRTGIMIMLLSFIRKLAPSMNRRGFGFSMNGFTSQHPGDTPHGQNPDQSPLHHNDTDQDDPSNVTIEGDYKRRD